jgi:hypothetical protein
MEEIRDGMTLENCGNQRRYEIRARQRVKVKEGMFDLIPGITYPCHSFQEDT